MKKQKEVQKLAELMRMRGQLSKEEFAERMVEIKENLDIYDEDKEDSI